MVRIYAVRSWAGVVECPGRTRETGEWQMGMIGERVVRTEDPALLTGGGTFVDNLDIPGAVHVVYVRSQMAHATITAIDTSEAAGMPGVLGVFTAADLDLGPFPLDIPFLPAN